MCVFVIIIIIIPHKLFSNLTLSQSTLGLVLDHRENDIDEAFQPTPVAYLTVLSFDSLIKVASQFTQHQMMYLLTITNSACPVSVCHCL